MMFLSSGIIVILLHYPKFHLIFGVNVKGSISPYKNMITLDFIYLFIYFYTR